MNTTALLIIDVQLGIFMRKEYDGMAVYQEETFLANLQSLLTKARAAKAPVIYIQHMYKDFPLMEKGQPMWNVHPAIMPLPGDIIIEKNHADAFYESDLEDTLRRLGVNRLVITGLQTAYCVDTTCRRAHSLGFDNILVTDGHSTLDSDTLTASQIIAHHNAVLGSQFAATTVTSQVEF